MFLPIPGTSFDFDSLSFHVPIWGLAAKQAAVATNNAATATTAIRVLIMRGIPAKIALAVNTNSSVGRTPGTVKQGQGVASVISAVLLSRLNGTAEEFL